MIGSLNSGRCGLVLGGVGTARTSAELARRTAVGIKLRRGDQLGGGYTVS